MADPRVSGASPLNPQALRSLQEAAREDLVLQVESERDLEQWCEQDAFNPMAMMRRFRNLDEFKAAKQSKTDKQEQQEKKVREVEAIEETAARFQKNNEEFQAKALLFLRSLISSNDSPEEMLRKVMELYPDPALADEAFEFLIATGDARIAEIARLAKEELNSKFERAVKAGRNMGAQAREFAKSGLGSATSLRELYKQITGTPREPIELFEELTGRFPFAKLATAIRFLLHSLGADLRSKGSSIEKVHLQRLVDDIRSLQGILTVFRFFKGRMGLIKREFTSYQLACPESVTFETLAKQFVKLLNERFLSPEKIMDATKKLGVSDEAIAKLIVLIQMRDAVRQIPPRYYRSHSHRDETLKAFLKALDNLEEILSEEEEKEQQERKKRKKKP